MNRESRVTRNKKPFYKKWWVWLILGVFIIVIIYLMVPKEQAILSVDTKNITQQANGEAKFKFSTNKGNKYKIVRISDGTVYGPKVAKTGSVDITLYNSGKFKIISYFNSQRISKKFTIHPYVDKETSTKSESSSSKPMDFGKGDMVGNSDMVASITVKSVQKVDPDDVSVTDISHNYSGMQQYVIVNYTVNSVKGDIPLDDFDGSELSVADSNGTIGTQSSNRDNGIPETLSEGQNADLRIGVGLKHAGNEVTIKFNDLTWKGQIQ